MRLAADGRFAGVVLDAGCGTGENALHIAALGVPVLGFDGAERPGYLASLASVTEHGGTLYVLCFSDEGPDTGPHPSARKNWAGRSARTAGGPSSPSNRTGSRPDSTTLTVPQPGSRPSSGSSRPDGRSEERR